MARRRRTEGQVPLDRDVVVVNKGILTDAATLALPPGSSFDEENFELLRDGSRRRRRGLQYEAGHTLYEIDSSIPNNELATFTSTSSNYRWTNVGGDPNLTFIVCKVGVYLMFWLDGTTLSTGRKSFTVNLLDFATTLYDENSSNYSYVADVEYTFTSGHGHLFVASPHTETFFVEYIAATDSIKTNTIHPLIRDFYGVDDGVPIQAKPATLTKSHEYNLVNRGWTYGNINNYFNGVLADASPAAKNKYPAKNMIPFKAMVRHDAGGTTSKIYTADWRRKFDANAVEAQIFGNVDAPQGSLFIDPYNNQLGVSGEDPPQVRAITALNGWEASNEGTYWKIALRWATNNGDSVFASNDIITYVDTKIRYRSTKDNDDGPVIWYELSLSGQPARVLSGAGAPTATVVRTELRLKGFRPYDFEVVVNGSLTTRVAYERPDANSYETSERPQACAMWAGRLWLAGINHPQLADQIMFSQIAASEEDAHKYYDKMHQKADPTSEFQNQLVASDGGTIQVPGVAGIVALVPLQNSLMVLSKDGVWEITGGDRPFTASNYFVRQLATVEVYGPSNYALTDQGLVVTSPSGVYIIRGDENSNLLTAQPLTYASIQSLWLSIPIDARRKAIVHYNDLDYKVSIWYNRTPTYNFQYAYDTCLSFDFRQEAWTKLTFDNLADVQQIGFTLRFIHTIIALDSGDGCVCSQKFKYLIYTSQTGVSELNDTIGWADISHSHLSFEDVTTGAEKPAYLITSYDMGDALSRYKQSPYLVVFTKRTEKGFDEIEPDVFSVINEGGLYVQGLFNFGTSSASNKWTSAQQAYRPKYFEPTSETDTDGFAVYASKLKLRGRGRSVALRFSTEPTKDAHLIGYSMEYKIERNV